MLLTKFGNSPVLAQRPRQGVPPKCRALCALPSKHEAYTDRRSVAVALGAALITLVQPTIAGPAYAKNTKAAPTPVEQVQGLLKALDANDETAVLAACAKNVLFKAPVSYPGDNLGGEFKGRYGALTYLTRWKNATEGLTSVGAKVTPGDGPDQVVVTARLQGRMKATGNKFSLSTTRVFRVGAEGIVSMVTYYDGAPLAKAAGVKTA
uniref:SnoaL-like domain-containing protein n=1 Tax=Chlamydomonas leiostraca TaxID=1034604 RepID=A0A7S0RGZ6_9CHLO|mmetsp:Transcript_21771/g.55410  ORF Transcript_21771/g.55410 Transcript_21771/m.55410 type:complete len:208 (+) Transcript_21771:18-641(+)